MLSVTSTRWTPVPLCVAILLASAWWIRQGPDAPEAAPESYLASAGRAIDDIPYKIGPFVGVDAPVSEAARELLKPNRVLQRRYVDKDDPRRGFSLVFVHCGLTRDMEGHYPPICYPAHGWTLTNTEPYNLQSGQGPIPATRYGMKRGSGLGERRLVIYNFFAVPSLERRFAADVGALSSQDVVRTRLFEGVAQVQVIFDEDWDASARADVLSLVLDAASTAILRVQGVLG